MRLNDHVTYHCSPRPSTQEARDAAEDFAKQAMPGPYRIITDSNEMTEDGQVLASFNIFPALS